MRYTRKNILKYTYFYRVVGTWNSLPEYIRRPASVNSFKVLDSQKVFFYGKVHAVRFYCYNIITMI